MRSFTSAVNFLSKGDIFQNYTEKNFEKYINENGKIISITNVSKSGRKIYEFER